MDRTALSFALLLSAIGCSGPTTNKTDPAQPILQAVDSRAIGAAFSVFGSGVSDSVVGMRVALDRSEAIALLRSDLEIPTIQVIPIGLAGKIDGATIRLMGMGTSIPKVILPDSGQTLPVVQADSATLARKPLATTGATSSFYWLTATLSSGEQVLGVLNEDGILSNILPVSDSEPGRISMTCSSAITMGHVGQDGSFFTPRFTTSEAGSVNVAMHNFTTSLKETKTPIAGMGARGGDEGPAIGAVVDFYLDSDNQPICAYGQIGIAAKKPDGTYAVVPYSQAPAEPVTHIVQGRSVHEAIVLGGSKVLAVDTRTGEVRSISIGKVPFASNGAHIQRLFVNGNTAMVVGDSRIVRFNIATGEVLAGVAFDFGPVVAAEQSGGKLFLAHAGGKTDILSWISCL